MKLTMQYHKLKTVYISFHKKITATSSDFIKTIILRTIDCLTGTKYVLNHLKVQQKTKPEYGHLPVLKCKIS